jgi:ribosomal protein S18 acetylase RimI-like enzyme
MLQIRPATVEDADAIARVFLESADYHARLESDRYWIPPIEPVLERYRERARRNATTQTDTVTLLAVLDGKVVGFIDAELDRSPDLMHRDLIYCQIVEIAVAVGKQGQGIGTRLLMAAEDWGRERGAHLAALEFLSGNTRASAFYQQRMGYRVVALRAIKPLG